MATSERVIPDDHIRITSSGNVEVRERVVVEDQDGNVLRSFYHRYVVQPGQKYGNRCPAVKAACDAAHTKKRIKANKARLASQE